MEDKKHNLNLTFNWYNDTIAKSVMGSCSSFFENNFKMFLSSINDFESIKSDPMLKNELFYSCQISIKNKQHILLRLSSDFIRIVFHDLLGSNQPVFDLEKITELEKKVLNGFFEYIVKGLEDYLIDENQVDKIDPLEKTNLNFVFMIKNKEIPAGKLCVTIPLNRLQPKPVTLVNNFSYDDFINNFAFVDIIAGCAKISLDDLKSLDKDDILVLENSDIKTMTLKTSNLEQVFKVNPEPSIMIDLDGDEDDESDFTEENKEYVMVDTKSVWDDIQIEVSAEFKKVKMTLGELKQISKGLVIDLGPIMNNEISLLVENKAVAKGELVIINDKYGVKINEVYASKKEEAPKAKQEAPQTPQGNVPPQRPMPARPAGAVPPKPAQRPAGAQGNVPPQRPMPARPAGAVPPKPAPKPQGAPQTKQGEDFDYSNFEE